MPHFIFFCHKVLSQVVWEGGRGLLVMVKLQLFILLWEIHLHFCLDFPKGVKGYQSQLLKKVEINRFSKCMYACLASIICNVPKVN